MSDLQITPAALDLAQYQALRQEILDRTKTQNQLASLALVGLGTLLAVATKTERSSGFLILLAYPFLVTFLAIGWTGNRGSIEGLASFIRQLEARVYPHYQVDKRGWQHSQVLLGQKRRKKKRSRFYTKFFPRRGYSLGQASSH